MDAEMLRNIMWDEPMEVDSRYKRDDEPNTILYQWVWFQFFQATVDPLTVGTLCNAVIDQNDH
jgi:hypothetical protein